MRAFHVVVFDDILQNTTPVYTDPEHNCLLASADQVACQVISNVFSGGPRLTLTIQQSPDGRTWGTRSGTPELDHENLSWTDTNNHVIYYDKGMGCHVRFRLELNGSATVRVKIIACGRSRTARPARSGMSSVQPLDDWPIEGGDDVLFDDDTKRTLAILEDNDGCDEPALQMVRAELRRQARAMQRKPRQPPAELVKLLALMPTRCTCPSPSVAPEEHERID